jgi:hypothetical protein
METQSTKIEPKFLNRHVDHIASCLCCKKLIGDMGDNRHMEDVTPGTPAEIACLDGIFSFDENDNFPKILKTLHDSGRICKFFLPREED